MSSHKVCQEGLKFDKQNAVYLWLVYGALFVMRYMSQIRSHHISDMEKIQRLPLLKLLLAVVHWSSEVSDVSVKVNTILAI